VQFAKLIVEHGVVSTSDATQPDPFDLVLREPFLRPVVKLGRARALMRRHFLRGLGLSALVKDLQKAQAEVAGQMADAGPLQAAWSRSKQTT
jgi:hypothetical protein